MIEELLGKNTELIAKILDIIEGKEVSTKLNLDGVTFNVGKTKIKLNGEVEFSFARKKTKG